LEYFRRCQGAPICFNVAAMQQRHLVRRSGGARGQWSLTRALLHVLGHADQIQILSLTCTGSWYQRVVEPALLSKGIHLRELQRLNVSFLRERRTFATDLDLQESSLVCAESLMLGSRITGKLRRLALNSAYLDWDSPLNVAFRSLSHLALISSEGNPLVKQENQWRIVLGYLTALVSLDLYMDAVPTLTSRPELALIVLPSLARLHLIGATFDVLQFCKAIHLPEALDFKHSRADPHMGMFLHGGGPPDLGAVNLCSFLAEIFFGGPAAGPGCIVIDDNYEARPDDDMTPAEFPAGAGVVLNGGQRSARLMLPAEELFPPLLANFQSCITVVHVLTPWKSHMHNGDVVVLWLLPALTNVRELHVSLPLARDILERDILPALSVLHICWSPSWHTPMLVNSQPSGPEESSMSGAEDENLEDDIDEAEMVAYEPIVGADAHLLFGAIAGRRDTLRTVHLDRKLELSVEFVTGLRGLGMMVVITNE
jgi:hypothetical protein